MILLLISDEHTLTFCHFPRQRVKDIFSCQAGNKDCNPNISKGHTKIHKKKLLTIFRISVFLRVLSHGIPGPPPQHTNVECKTK